MNLIAKYNVLIFLFFLNTLPQEKQNLKGEYLARFCIDEYCEICGYKNQNGDTIIEAGKYSMCLTDTIRKFGSVLKPGIGFIGINNKDKYLFKIFTYDNGPDYISDGLFRIVKNGKIGYADTLGNIIINPKYKCACQFENGKAKVSFNCEIIPSGEYHRWESENWFFIDKKGKRIKQ